MKRIGIVGGIGPESTIEYYRLLIAERHLAITIDSVEVRALLDFMQAGALPKVADYLVAAVTRLAGGGADFALIAANTPHIVFDEVARRAPIPMVSIVEAACEHVASLGLSRVALLGTRYTMEGHFYQDVFTRRGIPLVIPSDADRTFVHDRYINEFLQNIFSHETREGLLAVIDRMVERDRIEAVILGGTELPLILTGDAHDGVRLLDTTRIHVGAALKYARASDERPS
jgi:aspartate racemase